MSAAEIAGLAAVADLFDLRGFDGEDVWAKMAAVAISMRTALVRTFRLNRISRSSLFYFLDPRSAGWRTGALNFADRLLHSDNELYTILTPSTNWGFMPARPRGQNGTSELGSHIKRGLRKQGPKFYVAGVKTHLFCNRRSTVLNTKPSTM